MTSEQETEGAAKSESGRIMRAAGVIFSTTMLSRVLGFVRDAVAAAVFGLGPGMDAFVVAFRIPSMLRSLLAEGSLAVSFIPVFVELEEKEGRERANRLGRVTLTLVIGVLAGVTLLGILAAPWIVSLTALGFERDPAKFALTARLTAILFPFIGLVSITGFLGGILNSRGWFTFPALSPAVLNVCLIASILCLGRYFDPPIIAMAAGVLIGGGAQLLLQLLPARRAGFTFVPDFRFGDPALKKVFLLLGPSVFGVAVYQINIIISTFLVSWLEDGSVSYLYYAERLFQLPLGLFAVSVGVASLPSLSRLAARGEWGEFGDTVQGSLRYLWFFVVPAAVGLFILAEPLIVLLFKRGLFTAAMAANTAVALRYYTLALVPVATTRVVAQSFYAMKDTSTPVRGALASLLASVAASLALMGPMGYAGLALATALGSAANMLYLLVAYRLRMGFWPLKGSFGVAGRILLAATVMGALVKGALVLAGDAALGAAGTLSLAGVTALLVVLGIIVYALAGAGFGLREPGRLLERLRAL